MEQPINLQTNLALNKFQIGEPGNGLHYQRVPVAKVGKYKYGEGKTFDFTSEVMDKIIQTTNDGLAEGKETQFQISHKDGELAQELDLFLGYSNRFYREGDVMYTDMDILPDKEYAVASGKYRALSLGIGADYRIMHVAAVANQAIPTANLRKGVMARFSIDGGECIELEGETTAWNLKDAVKEVLVSLGLKKPDEKKKDEEKNEEEDVELAELQKTVAQLQADKVADNAKIDTLLNAVTKLTENIELQQQKSEAVMLQSKIDALQTKGKINKVQIPIVEEMLKTFKAPELALVNQLLEANNVVSFADTTGILNGDFTDVPMPAKEEVTLSASEELELTNLAASLVGNNGGVANA